MNNLAWPIAAVIVSLIWAGAWVLRARFEYGPYTQNEGFDLEAPEEEEEE